MKAVAEIPYEELTAAQKLRAFWDDFTQCDWWHDDFEEEMEAAGFIKFEQATKEDVREASFAEELGIIAGQPICKLTQEGRAVLSPVISEDRHDA